MLNYETIFLVSGIFENLSKQVKLLGQKFMKRKSFFYEPCDSLELDIQVVYELFSEKCIIKLKDVKNKVLRCTLNRGLNEYVVIPLLHNEH